MNNEINDFQDWLKINYKINLSNNLKEYYLLSFEEFIDEMKNKKVKVNKRDTFDDLKREYNKSLITLKPLIEDIESINENINKKVYELYEMNEKEIKIIEENF